MDELVKMDKEEKALRQMIERLKGFTTPELCDGAGLCRCMDWQIKPWVGDKKICGPAVTVDVPSGEGDLVADAILKLNEGDILVVAGKGNCDCSYWGDHRSLCASMMKAAGVVIDGAFRDAEGCREAGFPVFAKGLTCRTAQKNGTGAINIPVSCGGVTVNPKDLIVGDENGVIVLSLEEAQQAMEQAKEKRMRQDAVIKRMQETGEVIPKIPKKVNP